MPARAFVCHFFKLCLLAHQLLNDSLDLVPAGVLFHHLAVGQHEVRRPNVSTGGPIGREATQIATELIVEQLLRLWQRNSKGREHAVCHDAVETIKELVLVDVWHPREQPHKVARHPFEEGLLLRSFLARPVALAEKPPEEVLDQVL